MTPERRQHLIDLANKRLTQLKTLQQSPSQMVRGGRVVDPTDSIALTELALEALSRDD